MVTSSRSSLLSQAADVRAWITETPIQVQDVLDSVGGAADGAIVVFLGTVRDHNDGRPVRGMRYDAYRGMAEQVLTRLATDVSVQLGTDRVAVVHRTGELAIGDISVALAVSSPHREQAFAAARALIEQLKQQLPVWKHEHYADGESVWLPGSVPAVQP